MSEPDNRTIGGAPLKDFPVAQCDVCGKSFPEPTLLHMSRTDRRLACMSCGIPKTPRWLAFLWGIKK